VEYMNILRFLLPSVLSLVIMAGNATAASEVKVITLSAYNTLRYSPDKIEASPGQKIILTLKNESTLPKNVFQHNWVLLRAGADPYAYSKAALGAKADNYMPKSLASEVIVGVPLVGPQESQTITFNAPKTPGTYPFLCSCPCHAQYGMNGVLIVK